MLPSPGHSSHRLIEQGQSGLKLHTLPSQSKQIRMLPLAIIHSLWTTIVVLRSCRSDSSRKAYPNFGVVGVGQDTVSLIEINSSTIYSRHPLLRTDSAARLLALIQFASLSLRETGCMSPCWLAGDKSMLLTTSRSRDWCTEIIQGNKGENSR